MYKLDFLLVDLKKVITDKGNKTRGKIFHAYYFKKTFIQINNFVRRVLSNYRPKKKEPLKLKLRSRFLLFISSILKRILFTPLLNRNVFILWGQSDVERMVLITTRFLYSTYFLGFYFVFFWLVPYVCLLMFSSYCSPTWSIDSSIFHMSFHDKSWSVKNQCADFILTFSGAFTKTNMKSHPRMKLVNGRKKYTFTGKFHPVMKWVEFHPSMKIQVERKLLSSLWKHVTKFIIFFFFFSVIETINLLEEIKVIEIALFNNVTNICYVDRCQH